MDSAGLAVRAKGILSSASFGLAAASALWMLGAAPAPRSLGVLPATALVFFVATLIAFARLRGLLLQPPVLSARALFRGILAGSLLAASTAFLIMGVRLEASYLACIAFTAAGVALAPVFRRLTWGGHLSLAQRSGALLCILASAPWLIVHPAANGMLLLSALFQSVALASWSPANASEAPRQTYWFWAIMAGGVVSALAAIGLQGLAGMNELSASVRVDSLTGDDLRALCGVVSLGAMLSLRLQMVAEAGRLLSGGRVALLWVFTLIMAGTILAGLHQVHVTPLLFASLPTMLIGVMLARISLQEGMSFRGLVGISSSSDAVSSRGA